MNINLSKLLNHQVDEIVIDEIINIPKEYLNDDIKDISEVKVKGNITNNDYLIELNLNISCNLTLICSISLKDVDFPVNINVNEELSEEDSEEFNKILNNSIDLLPIIWQNILMEIPMKVVSPDVKEENVYGDGWKFITNEEEEDKEIDPRLSKLKDLLDE